MTAPRYRGEVPTPTAVLGVDFKDRPFTLAEADRYLDAVAAASSRVWAGTLGISPRGKPLRYAVVGAPDRVTPHGLAEIGERLRLLRDPATPPAAVDRIIAETPAVVWLTAGVHGSEPAGTNAVLRVLRDLADRDDCAARAIVDTTVVVIVPVQNPEGYETGDRWNGYGFDLNRDWFALTQPETRAVTAAMAKLPPVAALDLHEMEGDSYFAPPYAAPVHHEVPAFALESTAKHLGPAVTAEFDRQGIDLFSGREFDLLYPGTADAANSIAGLAAGITLEKGIGSPVPDRVGEHYLASWMALSTVAGHSAELLRAWNSAHRTAFEQGKRGPVRHYFLFAGDNSTAYERDLVLWRLQQRGVEIHKLAAPLRVPDLRHHGRPARAETVPAGSYWIPLAQHAKHWVQTMLGEQNHATPPIFSDLSAWGLPLLAGVDAAFSGAVLRPAALPCPPLPEPAPPRPPARSLALGVLRFLPPDYPVLGSVGWLNHRLERVWRLPFRTVPGQGVTKESLRGIDVLLVPDAPAQVSYDLLGEGGRAALREWVRAGGRYVGWGGTAQLAGLLGITSTTLSTPAGEVPGALVRVRVDTDHPLGKGLPGTVWHLNDGDLVLRAGNPSYAVASYPPYGSPDWFVSGHAVGADELGGTAVVTDEPHGSGRVTLFSGEPNLRAFTDGMAKLLRNAALRSSADQRAAGSDTAAAERAARRLPETRTGFRVTVPAAGAPATRAVLSAFGARWIERGPAERTTFVIDNDSTRCRHPWASRLPKRLSEAGVSPLAVVLPR
ncbi:hypothetical protein NLX83_21775 [Allokutzneria sp. A3M-2-11 16]|uniref:M14 family zinc carboxypeptidase n=1 Tax=Allokutzneria sp. A3M-2-11 16 TaxID=2962043 RepID=UPI0020B6E0BB|nr:M14 family zinc carboxypeptidase [Allokutzneria sp. A3M-2-11 16]MCP3801900.1 hypothetical protein [Allokutzneria sp. A3M-2-11 16]